MLSETVRRLTAQLGVGRPASREPQKLARPGSPQVAYGGDLAPGVAEGDLGHAPRPVFALEAHLFEGAFESHGFLLGEQLVRCSISAADGEMLTGRDSQSQANRLHTPP